MNVIQTDGNPNGASRPPVDVYLPYSKLKQQYAVGHHTLKRWEEAKTIRTVHLPGGKRLFARIDVEHVLGVPAHQKTNEEKKKIIYARVSSEHQRPDLERQIQFLKTNYPQHELVSDIGSGLNWERKGFKTILDLVYDKRVQEVVVAYKDRLCRFGFELLEWLFQKSECKILVHHQDNQVHPEHSNEQELSEDLLAIVTVFVAKNNGLRSGLNRRKRKGMENTPDTTSAVKRPKSDLEKMVRDSSMDIQPMSSGLESKTG